MKAAFATRVNLVREFWIFVNFGWQRDLSIIEIVTSLKEAVSALASCEVKLLFS